MLQSAYTGQWLVEGGSGSTRTTETRRRRGGPGNHQSNVEHGCLSALTVRQKSQRDSFEVVVADDMTVTPMLDASDIARYLTQALSRFEDCPRLTEDEIAQLDSSDTVTKEEVRLAVPQVRRLATTVRAMRLFKALAPRILEAMVDFRDRLSPKELQRKAAWQCIAASHGIVDGILRLLVRLFGGESEHGLGIPPAAVQPQRGLLPTSCFEAVRIMFDCLSLSVHRNRPNGRIVARYHGFLTSQIGRGFGVAQTIADVYRDNTALLDTVTQRQVQGMVRRLRVLHLGATQSALRGLRDQLNPGGPSRIETCPPLLGTGIVSLLRMLCVAEGVLTPNPNPNPSWNVYLILIGRCT